LTSHFYCNEFSFFFKCHVFQTWFIFLRTKSVAIYYSIHIMIMFQVSNVLHIHVYEFLLFLIIHYTLIGQQLDHLLNYPEIDFHLAWYTYNVNVPLEHDKYILFFIIITEIFIRFNEQNVGYQTLVCQVSNNCPVITFRFVFRVNQRLVLTFHYFV
jgi:hypothetical protein